MRYILIGSYPSRERVAGIQVFGRLCPLGEGIGELNPVSLAESLVQGELSGMVRGPAVVVGGVDSTKVRERSQQRAARDSATGTDKERTTRTRATTHVVAERVS